MLTKLLANFKDDQQLLPAIVQDANSKEVLMLAWVNKEALEKTAISKQATFWSRSRKEIWVKGQTSGNKQEVIRRGVGEILLNSMDVDGTRAGYDLELIRRVREISSVPVIASGGAGDLDDFGKAIESGADALLAASVFHFGIYRISDIKRDLSRKGFTVRQNSSLGEN